MFYTKLQKDNWKEEFIDNNAENSNLLRYVLLSCSYKIYVQKF